MKQLIIFGALLCFSFQMQGQSDIDPLAPFEYYIGIWVPPEGHPMAKHDPKMAHLQVINFEWGANRKLIRSTTGIISDKHDIPFSEGTITFNPNSKKIMWLEYQYDGDLLFEGEYIPLENGGLQRLYTVHYEEGYKSIPNPQEPGWTRLYRETFSPIGKDTIDWKTETFIGNEWIKAGTPNGFKAVRETN